jgi:hypothetical protein
MYNQSIKASQNETHYNIGDGSSCGYYAIWGNALVESCGGESIMDQKRLHFPKERVENEEITAATLKNFAKPLKVFCDCADKAIPWKK